jgi:hypothetical protein
VKRGGKEAKKFEIFNDHESVAFVISLDEGLKLNRVTRTRLLWMRIRLTKGAFRAA